MKTKSDKIFNAIFIIGIFLIIVACTIADETNRLNLPLIERNTAQSHLLINEGNWILDAIVAGTVARYPAAASPAVNAATEGDMFIVPAGAEGDWTGQEGNLAIYRNLDWAFVEPVTGMKVTHATQAFELTYTGNQWGPSPSTWTSGLYISEVTSPILGNSVSGRLVIDATHDELENVIEIVSNGKRQMELRKLFDAYSGYSQLSLIGPSPSGAGSLDSIILNGYTGWSYQNAMQLVAVEEPADASVTIGSALIYFDTFGDLKVKANFGGTVQTGTIVDFTW